ncbi:MAG: DUF3658 domain-containing protein [Candidatus Acidiferrum sp.]
MTDERIDQEILSMLSAAAGRWRKVAAVIANVSHALDKELPDGEEAYELVARRIGFLVNERTLLAQGDIKNWRFSEVRLPD